MNSAIVTLTRHRQILVALAFACAVFLIHATSRVIIVSDSQWSLYTAQSIIRQGDINLDEYRPRIRELGKFGVRRSAGHVYNFFPIGASLLALPFVAAYEFAPEFTAAILPGVEYPADSPSPNDVLSVRLPMERAIASFYVALAAFILVLISLRWLSLPGALVVGAVFAFASPAWSTASRGLWQHGPSMFALTATLWCLLKATETKIDSCKFSQQSLFLIAAGFTLGASYIIRPTNSLSIVGLGIYTLWRFRLRSYAVPIGIALAIVPFIALNLELYDRMLPPYFRGARLGTSLPTLTSLLRTVLSPNRGLLIFCPWVVLAIWGFVLGTKTQNRALYIAFTGIVTLHWIVISTFPIWWGGHSYGPRLFSDMLPYLALGLVPVVQIAACNSYSGWIVKTLLAITIAIAFAINYRGATSYAVHGWNVAPHNVDESQDRIWDWQDMQVLR